jgi:uncharacterized paraquat-inducible protein A
MGTATKSKVVVAICPECHERFSLAAGLRVGQRITCPHCDIDLEVLSVAPLELDWAFDAADLGWDDDEY